MTYSGSPDSSKSTSPASGPQIRHAVSVLSSLFIVTTAYRPTSRSGPALQHACALHVASRGHPCRRSRALRAVQCPPTPARPPPTAPARPETSCTEICGVPDARVTVLAKESHQHHGGTPQYPDELRERAICEVRTTGRPIAHVAKDLGIHKEALPGWVRQAEADRGERDDRLTTAEPDGLKQLHRRVAELRRANEILKAASVFLSRRSTVPGRGRAGDRPPA
ncbi:transposase [Streptomyces violaceorubidus]|uniref:Transposase n=1 Tax=Streptomyces violaceorubidus TaxID=284042 RepID=A0ABV1T5P0_9ACTN